MPASAAVAAGGAGTFPQKHERPRKTSAVVAGATRSRAAGMRPGRPSIKGGANAASSQPAEREQRSASRWIEAADSERRCKCISNSKTCEEPTYPTGRGNGHLLQPSVRKFSAHYRARCRICAPRERCEEIRGRKITGNARVVAKQNALEREVQLF